MTLERWLPVEEAVREARKKDLAKYVGKIYRYSQIKALEKRFKNVYVRLHPFVVEDVEGPDEFVYVSHVDRPVKYIYYVEYIPLGTKDRDEAEKRLEDLKEYVLA